MPDIRINDVSVQLHKALKQKALDEGISLRALLLPFVELAARPKRGEPR
jgi:hypothetical protein